MTSTQASTAPPTAGRAPKRPSLALLLTEPVRSALDLATLPVATPLLRRAPSGDGHGVLVLPGLGAADGSTRALRSFLRGRGYRVWGWRLGRNVGPTRRAVEGMRVALEKLVEQSGGPVSVVGWSLGGIFARELSRDPAVPVRQVITLGSPFAATSADQTWAETAYRRQSRRHVESSRGDARERLRQPLAVPSTAVYSRRDGIVAWRACTQEPAPQSENVEVRCSHLGFGVDPATLWVVADRLAQPADAWTAFRPPARLRLLYPRVPADLAVPDPS